MDYPKGNIPIKTAAELMGKSPHFVRLAMQQGTLPIGAVIKNGSKSSYYISPKLFHEVTGFFVDPANE